MAWVLVGLLTEVFIWGRSTKCDLQLDGSLWAIASTHDLLKHNDRAAARERLMREALPPLGLDDDHLQDLRGHQSALLQPFGQVSRPKVGCCDSPLYGLILGGQYAFKITLA